MILCCGEALIDMIPRQIETGETAYVPHCGGAVFNTAIALGRLGARAGLLTGLSEDHFGRQLGAALAASNVDSSHCVTSRRPTTLAFVHLENGQAAYAFHDENSALRGIRTEDLDPVDDAVRCLYFGGISLCHAPAAETFLQLAEDNAGRRCVMLDPNIRPGFITDPAAYRDRLQRLAARADVVKVSDEDLDWIFPGPASQAEKIARLLATGPGLVLLTLGAEGAACIRRDGRRITVPARRARVVDTVGAGDTFNAGFLACADDLGLLAPGALTAASDAALAACLGHGARVAAVTVSRAGANPPWRHELKDDADP